MSQTVVIYGPNLSTPTGETFHVHAQGCADLHKAPWRNIRVGGDQGGYVETHDSIQSVVEETYADQIEESGDTWEGYVFDFKFYPCVTLS